MRETNYEYPCEWIEWEKQYITDCINSHVCETVGFLQSVLLNAWPLDCLLCSC
ncbi:hypothetical protein P3X46_022923 [Hevea brasiliensis]|uniref:Uncharacterized protein n=1 Tax=Hevea brasiliensis TaxID=3981 RepID=A0ABQ9LB27_HEVBR|nr:hypothetical protein P3X46_022923 [Hevea brasiliensis]